MTRVQALCRDCFTLRGAAGRCGSCASPRLLRHPELTTLAIAHVDCDAFYAAVEKRDRPELTDRPVIVGGGRRGVVATACYIARLSGVRSAMPMFKALAACPDAVVIRPDFERYSQTGREIRALMRALTPLVEPLSIDEAFLDLSGTERVHGRPAAAVLAAFAAQVEREVGVTVSIGLSYNKFLAKVASEIDKPRGFTVIGRGDASDFLADKPVSIIWGVGRTLERRLARDGLNTLADLRGTTPADLARRYGELGLRLHALAHGRDARPVRSERETKSVSAETTFDGDIADHAELGRILWRLSERVSERLKAKGLAGGSLTLKLKTADFKIRTRSRQLAHPTRLADHIHEASRHLLAREPQGRRYRLIGVGISDLGSPDQADPPDLVDTGRGRRALAEAAMDKVRERFGRAAVERGLAFGEPSSRRARR